MSVYYKDNVEQFRVAVASMLDQTVPPDDFVIVCDGPVSQELDDEITGFVSRFHGLFQIVRESVNRGLGYALKIGLDYCKYDLVARMDSDDISDSRRMERLLDKFCRDPGLSVAGGQITEFISDPNAPIGKREVPLRHEDIAKRAKTRNPMNHMTVVFRKQAVLECGGYLPFEKFEDYYLWVRMLHAGKRFCNVSDVCVYARVNEQMYMRRGGAAYFRQIMKMERFLLQSRFITYPEFLKNTFVRFLVSVLFPNGARARFYQAVLRKKENAS